MLGFELKIARVISGKSQGQVAQEAGVSAVWLCTLEKGRTTSAKESTIERLKVAAGWTPELAEFLRDTVQEGRHSERCLKETDEY